MVTGEIKNRIDSIWDTFWTGGITNSITILEQMTYLFFMKMLDDAQRTKEANASAFGVTVKYIDNIHNVIVPQGSPSLYSAS